ncbi:MAG: FAD-dependent oxidoreductase [Alphaproteobacteria bacterium]|nr:FAD-dependent oxidoreductase [Alphaproteobacteria bacterium]
MAGLCTALALAPTGRVVTLLDRDPPPPHGDADVAFADWRRRGVGHLRHSHAFLARLREFIRAEHPDLLSALLESGAREIPFARSLTEAQRSSYAPHADDAQMTFLTSRRTTLEWVMRRYVERLPAVTIRANAMVKRLMIEDGAPLIVRGVAGEDDTGVFALEGDIVVDASGRMGASVERLIAAGAPIRETGEPAGILYYTRHYRLLPGQSEPPREGVPPATGDLGFLKFGVFPADEGCFSVTLAAPEIEMELRKALVDPALFQRIAMLIPGLRLWVEETRAAPASAVFGMGELHSVWRDFAPDGAPAALNFFAVGDSHVRTNPLYGRGCSFAAVAAQALREALDGSADPRARARAFEGALTRDLRPFYEAMLKQDRSAIRRARHALTPGHRPRWRARLLKSFAEDGVGVALRADPNLLRDAMRAFHMLDAPDAWIKRPATMVKILGYWARGRRVNAAFYPPKAGPERAELFTAAGIDARADLLGAA